MQRAADTARRFKEIASHKRDMWGGRGVGYIYDVVSGCVLRLGNVGKHTFCGAKINSIDLDYLQLSTTYTALVVVPEIKRIEVGVNSQTHKKAPQSKHSFQNSL